MFFVTESSNFHTVGLGVSFISAAEISTGMLLPVHFYLYIVSCSSRWAV